MKQLPLVLVLILTGCASAPPPKKDCTLEIIDAKNLDVGWKQWDEKVTLPLCQALVREQEAENEKLLQDLVRCVDGKSAHPVYKPEQREQDN
jgi:hypothetical protein